MPAFAHTESRSHLVATLQPIRCYLLVYYCMFLLLGGLLGKYGLRRRAWRWVMLGAVLGGLMYGVSVRRIRRWRRWSGHGRSRGIRGRGRSFGCASRRRRTRWWRSMRTIFTRRARMRRASEDRRSSSLADASKDGGTAAIFPEVAERWMREQTADAELSRITDAERQQRLAPFGVQWMVLEQTAKTQLPCPYSNEQVKVCRLRSLPTAVG